MNEDGMEDLWRDRNRPVKA